MSFDYARSQATAARLLARFGQRVVLRKRGARIGGSASNPTFDDPAYWNMTAVDTEERARDRDGTLIGQSLRTLYVAVRDDMVAPEKGDAVLIAPGNEAVVAEGEPFTGAAHAVLEVRRVAPGGTVVLWECDLET